MNKDRCTHTVSTLRYSTLHTRAIRKRPPDGVFAAEAPRGPRCASATIHLPDLLNIGSSTDLHIISLIFHFGCAICVVASSRVVGAFDRNSIVFARQLRSRDRRPVAELCPGFRLV